MRHFTILVLVILLSAFKSKDKCNKEFKLISVTSQTSYGGAAGSGSATTYRIKLKAKRAFTMTSDSGFAQGKADKLIMLKDSFNISDTLQLKKGQIFEVYFVIREEVQMGGGDYQLIIPGSNTAKAPVNTKNGAVIRYGGGKDKTMTFSTIKQLETIYAP